MIFDKESDFEEAVIGVLVERGWEPEVIRHPSEADLLKNWADILFNNNRQRNCLNECPLTDGEMQQIMEQIINLRTPLKLNSFINGRSVSITRDNPDDELHFGKEVSLKIYDRQEIAYGESRYQIVQQPHFNTKSPILNDRRGDLMLLINGMPVIHIELKRSDIPVSDAYNQIIKYSHWRDLSISVSSSGYEEHHNPNRPTDAPFVRCLEKIDEIQQSVEDKVAYLVELKEEINSAIDKLENRDEQLLLRYRYLDDCSWEEISHMMNISIRSVHRIHGSALQNFVVPN